MVNFIEIQQLLCQMSCQGLGSHTRKTHKKQRQVNLFSHTHTTLLDLKLAPVNSPTFIFIMFTGDRIFLALLTLKVGQTQIQQGLTPVGKNTSIQERVFSA